MSTTQTSSTQKTSLPATVTPLFEPFTSDEEELFDEMFGYVEIDLETQAADDVAYLDYEARMRAGRTQEW